MDWYGVVAIALVVCGLSLLIGHAFGYIRGRDDEVARRKRAEADRQARELDRSTQRQARHG